MKIESQNHEFNLKLSILKSFGGDKRNFLIYAIGVWCARRRQLFLLALFSYE